MSGEDWLFWAWMRMYGFAQDMEIGREAVITSAALIAGWRAVREVYGTDAH